MRKPKRRQSMVDRHDCSVGVARQRLSVIARGVAGAGGEPAAMKRNEDRTLAPVGEPGSPQVQVEAVLTHTAGLLVPLDHARVILAGVGRELRTNVAVSKGFFDAGPGNYRLRRHEAVLAAGGR